MNILITGGASGLGEALTRKLAAGTANKVYFTYNGSEAKAHSLEAEFANAKALHCNFTDEASVSRLAAMLTELSPDALVNNAYIGSFIDAHFHKTPAPDFLREFQNNVMPAISLTQAAIQVFRKKKSGRIVTVLSAALVNTPPMGASAYVANKAYLEAMVKVWATENARFNISSNAVSPSFMQTSFTGSIDERLVQQMLESHPLRRFIEPEEVADAVAYLLSSSAQVNGINVVLNAGAALR